MVAFKYVWGISHFRRFKEDKKKTWLKQTDKFLIDGPSAQENQKEDSCSNGRGLETSQLLLHCQGEYMFRRNIVHEYFLHILTTYPSKRTRCSQQNYVQEHHQSIDIWFVSISVSNWTNAWKKNITFGRSVIRKQWLPKWDMPGHLGDFHHGPMAGIPANRGNMTCASLGQLISCLIKMTRFCQGIPMFTMFVVCCWNLHGLFEERDTPKYNDCFLLIMF